MGELLRIGAPAGAQFGIDVITWWAFTVFLVGRFDAIQLAANNICLKFLEISFMPAIGLGMTLSVVVGKSIGEGRRDLARRYTMWALRLIVGYMVSMGLMMAVFRYQLPALLTDSDEVVRAAAALMILCAVFQAFDGMTITFHRALHGAGDTLLPAIGLLISTTLILLGGGWLMATRLPQLGSIGPWLAATVHLIVIGVAFWARYRFGPWERIELIKPIEPDRAESRP
jgi:MATE family multidrug resistance protein